MKDYYKEVILLDGLSKRPKRFYKKTHKPARKKSIYRSQTDIDMDGIGYKKDISSEPIFKFPKLQVNFNWKKVIAILLIVISTGFISVYATDSVDFVKNKIDLVKLFHSGKYLILFQNNAEARATGGFIGSFAVVDIEYGKIKNFYIDTNIYKRDQKYDYILKRIAPEPLASWHKSGGNPYWSLRDANWAVDFPETAREIEWFYKNEGGENVDGVIALNATVVKNLLDILGPVNLPKYNQVVTTNNFFDTLHEEIEKKYFEKEENVIIDEPKTILKDMYSILIERTKDKKYREQIYKYVLRQLDEKEILLYFNNLDLENIVLAKNWGGEVKYTNGDYLYINNSNLGGAKSSLNVKQELELNSFINSTNEEVINELTIIRSHLGDGQWPDDNNKNYMRILVPLGAKIISAKMDQNDITAKINLGTEARKSVFGLWYTTKIGQTRILTIKYKLPDRINNKNYNLYLQKQPGSLDDEVEVIIDNMVKFRGLLDKDKEIK